MKKLSLYKLGFLGLAAFYTLIFCGADLFHTENCPSGRSDGMTNSGDVCPACTFKTTANSIQPFYTNLILPAEMVWINIVTHPTILLSNELTRQVSIRAPPSDITC